MTAEQSDALLAEILKFEVTFGGVFPPQKKEHALYRAKMDVRIAILKTGMLDVIANGIYYSASVGGELIRVPLAEVKNLTPPPPPRVRTKAALKPAPTGPFGQCGVKPSGKIGDH